ncbi:MAG: hypothetical protein KGJ10_00530 [Acidobacteriota bacterium]|nr:hypothetical protein [Acidobacteriota bacterium]MDE3043297.1 hypothetical protein [Acidobacteriota bacterium]MDE3107735.1 hypothetical protein [Acidobacteriota bacterium]MDE3222399.1 hypothetical protein [Acidobacteriota bacterium]
MRRRTLDLLLSWLGVLLTVGLLVAGSLLTWGYQFANSSVHSQLAAQSIYFPAKGSPSLASPKIRPYLDPYAGQQLLTGRQAEVWADHYIAVHLTEIGGGKTYAQVSAASMADPTNTKLSSEVQTLFRGETLRGLLLNAYAFWTFGQIAMWSAVGAFVAAALMLLLTVLGFLHYRREDPREVI